MKRNDFIKNIVLSSAAITLGSKVKAGAHLLGKDAFVHPGILHSREDMNRIRSAVKNNLDPQVDSFTILKSQDTASADYKIQGPFPYIARDGVNKHTKAPVENDVNAAYHNALMWVITEDKAHAEKSIEILNAYANTLKGITGSNDNALTASLDGFIFVNAAEIIRYTYGGWRKEDIRKCENMFRGVFHKALMATFFERPAYTNGNWGNAAIKAEMGFGIFLNDRKIFQRATGLYYSKNKDNGSMYNYIINDTGQCQESGRDQAHVMLGLGNLAEACQVGYNQGLDMFDAMDNRLLRGYEYTSRYNLGYDVPFVEWNDVTGKYSKWSVISQKARGTFRPVFEIAYNHYVKRKGLQMPWTGKVLEKIRPEGVPFSADNPGFGSLLFYLENK